MASKTRKSLIKIESLNEFYAICAAVRSYDPAFDQAKLVQAIQWSRAKAETREFSFLEIIPDPLAVAEKMVSIGHASSDGLIAHFVYQALRPDRYGNINQDDIDEVRTLFGPVAHLCLRDLLRLAPLELMPIRGSAQVGSQERDDQKPKFHLMAMWAAHIPDSITQRLSVWLTLMDSIGPHTPPSDRNWITDKTIDVIIPIAKLTGQKKLVDALGSSWVRIVDPEWYQKIRELKGRRRKKFQVPDGMPRHGLSSDSVLKTIADDVKAHAVDVAGVPADHIQVIWREKSDLSAYRTIKDKHITTIEEAEIVLRNDLEGLRVIVDTDKTFSDYRGKPGHETLERHRVSLCLMIHNNICARAGSQHPSTQAWELIKGEDGTIEGKGGTIDRTKDWISTPKLNSYTAAHTTIRIHGVRVEIQTTDKRWDYNNNFGSGSHTLYDSAVKVGGAAPPKERRAMKASARSVASKVMKKPSPLRIWHDMARTLMHRLSHQPYDRPRGYTAVYTDNHRIVSHHGPMNVAEFMLLAHGPLDLDRCIGVKIEFADPIRRMAEQSQALHPLDTELDNGDIVTPVLRDMPLQRESNYRKTLTRLLRTPALRNQVRSYFNNGVGKSASVDLN